MAARVLMFQGTGSDVGKSLIVAGLARALVARGLRVLPFKPQNMSNNAAVTEDGGEIGRAQALQARAARVPPSVHMNPVLLKPQSEVGAQIVVQGRVHGRATAAEYQRMKPDLMPFVMESFAALKASADIVLVEGAGSASEVNLRANDIANMGFARAAEAPVVLIGDIDRGGVIASLAGTKAVIDADDARLIRGFIVNKFRGDPTLFADGMARIEAATGWEALGLVPYFPEARLLPAEDALALDAARPAKPGARLKIAVPILPHIANFDDLDPLDAEPAVDLVRVRPGEALPGDADLVILPGSKATIAGLAALREAGFDIDIAAHLRRGGMVLGLCGGYQMLGRAIHDPRGIEGPRGKRVRPRPARCRDHAIGGEAARTGKRRHGGRRPLQRLRDAYGRDRGAGLPAPVRASRRWRGRRRSLGRWTRDRHLYSRAVRRRPPALGLASALRRGRRGDRLRCPHRGDARPARRPPRRQCRDRPAAQTSAVSAASTTTMAMRRPSARA